VALPTQVLTLQHPSVLRHQHCVWVKEFGLAHQEATKSWMTGYPSTILSNDPTSTGVQSLRVSGKSCLQKARA